MHFCEMCAADACHSRRRVAHRRDTYAKTRVSLSLSFSSFFSFLVGAEQQEREIDAGTIPRPRGHSAEYFGHVYIIFA